MLSSCLPASPVALEVVHPFLREHLAKRVSVVGPLLRREMRGEWAPAKVDLVLIHYLYGLVAVALPNAGPEAQIDFLRDLGSPVFRRGAFRRALHAAPPEAGSALPGEENLRRAVIAAEELGRRYAQAVVSGMGGDPNELIEPNSNVRPIGIRA